MPASITSSDSGSVARPCRSEATSSGGHVTRQSASAAASQRLTPKRRISTNASAPQAALESQASALNENVEPNGDRCTSSGTPIR